MTTNKDYYIKTLKDAKDTLDSQKGDLLFGGDFDCMSGKSLDDYPEAAQLFLSAIAHMDLAQRMLSLAAISLEKAND